MGNHIGLPLRDSVGFRAELRRNGIRYCRDRRPRRSVIVRIKVYVMNEILRSRCSLKDDKVKSADGDIAPVTD